MAHENDVQMELGSRSYLGKQIDNNDSDTPNENDAASYPNIGLGEIFYPKQHDLQNKIKLFAHNDDEDNENDENDENEIEDEADLQFISSTCHDRSCQIEFANESTTPIYCYWLHYDSHISQPPHTIHPEGSLRLNTYLTHPFVISTADVLNSDNFNTVIAVYIPTNPKHNIHHVIIDEDLEQVTVSPFDEEIKPRCKCGRILQQKDFKSQPNDDVPDEDVVDVCFGCDRYIADGDTVWICDNLRLHVYKIYCLRCAQQRSQPLAIIRAFASDIDRDYCCNKKYKNYPRNFPKLFEAHLFIENGLRVLSLATDLILIYVLINNNLEFEQLSSLEMARIAFTFLPGLIICVSLLILYHVQNGCCCGHNDDDDLSPADKRKECLKAICIILALISLVFFYKIAMIGICMFRTIYAFKRISHLKPVPSDIEIKHINFLYPLLYDQVLSAWPLLIITLVQLIDFNHSVSLYSFTLFIKVISSTIILVFVDMDRLRLWRYSLYDAQMLVPVCILHTSRPYPMRARKLKQDKNDKNCVMCGEVCEEYMFFCAHSACNDNIVCSECTWQYLGKYQQHKQLDDEAFYEDLIVSTHFMKTYSDEIERFAAENGLGNIQRHCWSSVGGYIWTAKVMYNIFQICLLIVGCWVFQKVWLIEYFTIDIDGDTDTNNDSMISTIYGSLFLCIALIFECILIIIEISYLLPSSKIEKSVARVMFNLFFVFYLFGFSLLLFDYQRLSKMHIAIKVALIGFIFQLAIIPFLSIWQVLASNMYLWRDY